MEQRRVTLQTHDTATTAHANVERIAASILFLGLRGVTAALGILDDSRHERGSTIVTSQVPLDHWHEVIGDPTIADAVLDSRHDRNY